MTTAINWEELATTSHLDTVAKIKWLLDEQEYEDAREGLENFGRNHVCCPKKEY